MTSQSSRSIVCSKSNILNSLLLLLLLSLCEVCLGQGENFTQQKILVTRRPIAVSYTKIDSISCQTIKAERAIAERDVKSRAVFWDKDQGLPLERIWAFGEDKNHRIWMIGREKGLVCFDGVNFKKYQITKDPAPGFYALTQQGDSIIWIASKVAGLIKFDGKDFYNVRFDNEVVGINSLSVIGTELLVGTIDQGAYKISEKTGIHYDTPENDSIAINNVMACSGFEDGFALALFDKGILCITETDATLYAPNFPKSRRIYSLAADENKLWMAASSGLWTLDTDTQKLVAIYDKAPCYSIAKTKNRVFWVGTHTSEVLKIEGDQIRIYGNEDGINTKQILSVFEDSYENVWLGTFGTKVYILGKKVFENYPMSGSERENHRINVLAEIKDDVIFSSDRSGIFKIVPNGFEPYTAYNIPTNHVFNALLQVEDELWIGTQNAGIFVCTTTEHKKIAATGIEGFLKGVKAIVQNDQGKIYAAGWQGVFEVKSLQYSPLLATQECSANSLLCIDQEIWIAGEHGFGFYDILADKLYWQDKKVHGAERYISLALTQDSLLWIASGGKGIYANDIDLLRRNLRAGKAIAATHISVLELNASKVASLTETAPGTLWIGTENGPRLLNYAFAEGKIELQELRTFLRSDGLVDNDTGANTMLSAHGKIWMGTDKYLVSFNPKLDTEHKRPSLHIEQMDLFFEPYFTSTEAGWPGQSSERNYWRSLFSGYKNFDNTKPWQALPHDFSFSHEANHLTFHFRGINWEDSSPPLYRHRLLGMSENWSPWSNENSATYSNLSHGNYTLEVQTKDARSNTSEIRQQQFEIVMSFWQTGWFWGLLVLLIAIGIWTFVGYRTRAIVKENLRLENVVLSRTEALRREKRKSDNLLLNILPKETAEELKEKGRAAAKRYESVSVLFSDFKGFTQLTETADIQELVDVLDEFFQMFDESAKYFGLEKIKTIGDAYMCAGGVPKEDKHHAPKIVALGLEMLQKTEMLNDTRKASGLAPWPIRIGAHSGSVIAGVVGKNKFSYDIWGDTVNIAARMESSGAVNRLNISDATAQLVAPYFELESRGAVEAKNKGKLVMHYVTGLKPEYADAGNVFKPNMAFFKALRIQHSSIQD